MQVAPEETKGQIEHWAGRPWAETAPELYHKACEQHDNLARFLEDRGIVVHRPTVPDTLTRSYGRPWTEAHTQQYARDPWVVAGNHIVETAVRTPWRDRERYGLRPIADQLQSEGRDFHFVAMPPPPLRVWKDTVGTDYNEMILAGGDTFILGNDILIGWSGNDTTQAGIEWARKYFGSNGFNVHDIQISQEFLHLDDGLALVDEGLAIVCEDQYTYGMPKLLDGWDTINVTTSEAKDLLAGNGLILGPREILIDARLPHIAEQLTAKDVNVHTIEFDAVTIWAGGLRCSHHPIVRELD
jgi:N-dimethylarginine dimethylaminohydrolase